MKLLHITFFLLPFFLYVSIALQAIGYYLCALILPFLFVTIHSQERIQAIRRIGVGLVVVYLTFSVFNILHLFIGLLFENHKFFYENSSKVLTKNPISLSFLITGFVFVFKSFRPQAFVRLKNAPVYTDANIEIIHNEERNLLSGSKKEELLKPFLFGLMISGVLFFICAVLQAVYGFNLRGGILLSEEKVFYSIASLPELVTNGLYRVRGFYGHPLSLASVTIAYISFFLILFFDSIRRKERWTKEIRLLFPVIIVLNLIFLFLTQSRSAVTIQILAFIFLFFLNVNKIKRIYSGLIPLIFIAVFIAVYSIGLMDKLLFSFINLLNGGVFDQSDNRFLFWKVHFQMFLDHPLLGQGAYWIDTGIRELYYEKLGFGDFQYKFNAHNNYLGILSSVGLIGSGLIIGGIGLILKGLRVLNRDLFYPFLFAFIVNLIQAIFQNVFFDSSVTYIYLAFLCLIVWKGVPSYKEPV